MVSAAALVGSATLTATPVTPVKAATDEVTINVRSLVDVRAQIKFFAQNRSWVWPNASEAYVLDDYQTHSYTLTCIRGEEICFGAWSVARGNRTGRLSWGVGRNNNESCRNCCFTCGDGPYKTQELID
jgi:hypothetical protein